MCDLTGTTAIFRLGLENFDMTHALNALEQAEKNALSATRRLHMLYQEQLSAQKSLVSKDITSISLTLADTLEAPGALIENTRTSIIAMSETLSTKCSLLEFALTETALLATKSMTLVFAQKSEEMG